MIVQRIRISYAVGFCILILRKLGSVPKFGKFEVSERVSPSQTIAGIPESEFTHIRIIGTANKGELTVFC